MNGRVASLNVGEPRLVTYRGMSFRTGILKAPTDAPLTLKQLNFVGDGQADLSGHGGIDKAVYCYPLEHYEFWRREIGRTDLPMGQFGENITTEGVLEGELRIGDVLRMGTAVLQVSEPRIPCYKLVMHAMERRVKKRFFLDPLCRCQSHRLLLPGPRRRHRGSAVGRDHVGVERSVVPDRARGFCRDPVRRSRSSRIAAGRAGARCLGEMAVASAAHDRFRSSPPDATGLTAAPPGYR